jgi:copper chaperone
MRSWVKIYMPTSSIFAKKKNDMSTFILKTNIKCGGCIAAVKPFLDENDSIVSWEVDLNHPDRILKVETSLNLSEVKDVIQKAGYSAAPL